MPVLGNYGTNNQDGRKLEGLILGLLNREHDIQTPWVDYDKLKQSTKALEAFYDQALSFLSESSLIERNNQNQYRITRNVIIDYNERTKDGYLS